MPCERERALDERLRDVDGAIDLGEALVRNLDQVVLGSHDAVLQQPRLPCQAGTS